MASRTFDAEALLTPAEVAHMFKVGTKTVTTWANTGKLACVRTLGGHRRFRASKVREFLERSLSARSDD